MVEPYEAEVAAVDFAYAVQTGERSAEVRHRANIIGAYLHDNAVLRRWNEFVHRIRKAVEDERGVALGHECFASTQSMDFDLRVGPSGDLTFIATDGESFDFEIPAAFAFSNDAEAAETWLYERLHAEADRIHAEKERLGREQRARDEALYASLSKRLGRPS